MSLALIALNQILIMFLIMVLGFFCYKIKIINQETNKKLSDFLLLIVNPLLIFNSYQRDFNKELLNGLAISFALAIISHIVAIGGAWLLVRGKNKQDIPLERFSCIYSNCGFMGIPLVNSLYGSEGVFYLTAYMTVFNLLVWTHGVILMTGHRNLKALVKTLISPTFIASIAGLIFFLLTIRTPGILFHSMDYVASMNTPLAMLIAGVTLAQSEIKKIFRKRRIYLIIFIKQFAIPLVLLLLYFRLPLDHKVITTAVLASGCPVAATGTLFALRYNKNHLYASELYSVSTLAAIVTIPIIMLIASFLLSLKF